MKTLKEQLTKLQDLKNKRDTAGYRFYTIENQVILLELIIEEIEEWDSKLRLTEGIYMILSNPNRLATNNIRDVSLLLREVMKLNI